MPGFFVPVIIWAIAHFCGADATREKGEKAVQILAAQLLALFPYCTKTGFSLPAGGGNWQHQLSVMTIESKQKQDLGLAP